jgi:hypothetical protein
MTDLEHQLHDIERQVLAEITMRRQAELSVATRAHRQIQRLVLAASTLAGLIALWDMSLLARAGHG